MKAFRFAQFFGAIFATLALFVDAAFATPSGFGRSVQDESKIATQRVLLIGDETVVDSAVEPYGFTNELRKVMAEEEIDVEFVPLGKRGATFADWRALIANSYDKNEPTDVDGVFIKDELDKGADLIVLFLGFNDARKPSFQTFDFNPYSNELGYATLGKNTREGLKIVDVAAQLREDVSGLVDDLQKRVPGCRIVSANQIWENRPAYPGKIADAVYFVQMETIKAMKAKNCDHLNFNLFLGQAGRAARFEDEEIWTTSDGFHLNEYGSQIMTCVMLLALDQERKFNDRFQTYPSWLEGAYWGRAPSQPPRDDKNASFSFNAQTTNTPSRELRRLDWETIARRYYNAKVDRRLRDYSAPGFTLIALSQTSPHVAETESNARADEVCVKVLCIIRRIKTNQQLEGVQGEDVDPLKNDRAKTPSLRPNFEPVEHIDPSKIDRAFFGDPLVLDIQTKTPKIDKPPQIEIVSCGNLRYDGINSEISAKVRHFYPAGERGFFFLDFYGKPEDIPVDVTVAVNGVQKTVRVFRPGECAVSGVFPLEQEFSCLADYPQEKTITSVDYATLAGHNPVVFQPQAESPARPDAKSDAPLPPWKTPNPEETWTSAYSAPQLFTSRRDGESEPDPNWFNLATYRPNTPFSGVYVVRVFDSPKDQPATLKLGVKGYKTHVIERVYLNGAAVFTGELDVDAPEKQEVAVPTRVKEGRNIMVARVDRTQWDWIVGFTILDEEGRPLKDCNPFYEEN